ncbi:SDR family NAD(P)-dependent oxidoreductase [Marinomonas sp. C2222]|uniref:SDR family NAD(P)-dependent oxidoreductase n=1 Tax=Marinomonas sargassi TaxID=2984494 RepID=A0ABT2YUG7_9GAMM|nr:SDR family NAD(P)-dependent oxidoreductase [Marinomonas sargassi]MCV2403547.1 SDR family NAD(P)-dependent oxidoreductase [Marinomonas sargassi]
MSKHILITGATDGIGLLTAEKLVTQGHHVLIHGRNAKKLEAVKDKLIALDKGSVTSFQADLSNLSEVRGLIQEITASVAHLDVIINNAGVYKTNAPVVENNLDVRFVVNTIAPYLLTKHLMPLMPSTGRVVNLSSAAQAPVDFKALNGDYPIDNQLSAYAQSKLAITMWTRHLSKVLDDSSSIVIAVNPGSLLASKMVKEGFGMEGKDLSIGANILIKASLDDSFKEASGLYFDNDIGQFSEPHQAALDASQCERLVSVMEELSKPLSL